MKTEYRGSIIILLCVAPFVFFLFCIAGISRRSAPHQIITPRQEIVVQKVQEPRRPSIPQTPIPQWQQVPPLRATPGNLGTVLADIESHMPVGHIYRENDRVTWGHETTHGLNSRIRQMFGGNIGAFYCLRSRAAVFPNPHVTISQVAPYVPRSLRGWITYSPYMVGRSANEWNSTPLYICDEWSAYINGSATGLDLASKGMWMQGQRSDTLQNMLDFDVYVMTLAWVVKA